jgi:pimeloyl-ACP methyl ester carboxylesterase
MAESQPHRLDAADRLEQSHTESCPSVADQVLDQDNRPANLADVDSLSASEADEQAAIATLEQPTPGERLERSLQDIYFVSGLGADERVFRYLEFEGYRPVHIRWVEPKRGEAIEDYAKRLTDQIHAERPIIVGLSFGGMIATEMGKQIDAERIILLSSVKTATEVPWYFQLCRWFPIHRIFPFKTLLWAVYWFAYWVFGTETVEERKLLKAILLDTDAHFLKWALHRVVTWKNQVVPDCTCHIHGRCDRIFPPRFVNPDITLEQAGHLMVLNRAARISTLLSDVMS